MWGGVEDISREKGPAGDQLGADFRRHSRRRGRLLLDDT